jgi:hypothetical protein
MIMSCKDILIVYELHNDPFPTQVITQLTNALQKTYKQDVTLCIEDADNSSKSTTLRNLISQKKSAESLLIKDFDSPKLDKYISQIALNNIYFNSVAEAKKILTKSEQKTVLDGINKEFVLQAEVYSSGIKAIMAAKNYANVDMPNKFEIIQKYPMQKSHEIRDKYMADKIATECAKTEGYVIMLVGAGHYNIANNLRSLDHNPKEIYPLSIFRTPEQENSAFELPNYYCVNYDMFQKLGIPLAQRENLGYCKNYNRHIIGFNKYVENFSVKKVVDIILDCPSTLKHFCNKTATLSTDYTTMYNGCLEHYQDLVCLNLFKPHDEL